jgi:hypothetical protein
MAEPIVRTFEIDTSKSEQNLKSLGNAFDSADNSGKSLKAQLRELQQQLANTDPQTQKYRDLSQAAGELKDKIQDAAQAVGTQAGGAFEKVSGSLGLVTSRLLDLDFTGAAEGAQLLATNIGSIKFSDIAAGLEGLASSLVSVGKAVLTNPLFLIGGAIASAVIYWEELDTAIKSLNPELQRTTELTKALNDETVKQSAAVGKQVSQINALFNAVTDETKAESERVAALEAIQSLYPDVFKNQNIDINNTDALTSAKLTLVKAIEAEAKANAAKVLLETEYAKQFELQVSLAKEQANVAGLQAKEAEIVATSSRKSYAEIQAFTNNIVKAGNDTAAAQARVVDLQKEIALNTKNIADIEKVVGDSIVQQTIKTATAKKVENKKVVAEAKADAKTEIDTEKLKYDEKLRLLQDYYDKLAALQDEQFRNTLSQQDQEELAIIQKYEVLFAAADAAGKATIELQKQLAAELLAIQQTTNTAEVTNTQTTEETKTQLKSDGFKKGIELAASAVQILQAFSNASNKNNEKDAKRKFRTDKALAIGAATLQTAAAVTGALTAGGNPVKLATGAQFVEAGIAAALGLAQIVKIKNTEFGGGGGNDSNVNPSVPSTTDNTSQPATFNPFAAQFVANRPDQYLPRAYVLAGDVSSQQEVRENVEDLARIG